MMAPDWLVSWAVARLGSAKRPWVLGVQGPQGCGKSTLASALVDSLADRRTRAVTMSIDDFYLPHAEQAALSLRHPGDPTMLYRGYPGTHDIDLGVRTLDGLGSLRAGDEMLVPVYDKSAYKGRCDRVPREAWRRVVGPIDAIVFEGWMLGFAPLSDGEMDPVLRVPNSYLGAYDAWTRRLDALLQLDVASLDTIVRWRVLAERERRAQGQDGLSDEEARDYIERFLPAYRAYVPALKAHPPCSDFRTVLLDDGRGLASGPR
jgi:D-glycerate 3-kinase